MNVQYSLNFTIFNYCYEHGVAVTQKLSLATGTAWLCRVQNLDGVGFQNSPGSEEWPIREPEVSGEIHLLQNVVWLWTCRGTGLQNCVTWNQRQTGNWTAVCFSCLQFNKVSRFQNSAADIWVCWSVHAFYISYVSCELGLILTFHLFYGCKISPRNNFTDIWIFVLMCAHMEEWHGLFLCDVFHRKYFKYFLLSCQHGKKEISHFTLSIPSDLI